MPQSFFKEIDNLPQQKRFDDFVFPTVLSPNPNTGSDLPPTLSDLTDAIESRKAWLQSLFHRSGAVLFRGFPVVSPSDFNAVVEAFGYEEFPYVGGVAPRNKVVGRVVTANESPPEQGIPFHHEMSHSPQFPNKLFFYCEVEPGSGGETPVVLSHVIYERMLEKHPEFVKQLEERGLIYSAVIGEEDDPSSFGGRSWKSTFNTDDRLVAEERAAKLGMQMEWMEGKVRISIGPVPGTKTDEARGRKVWFNGVALSRGFGGSRDPDPEGGVTLEDGKPLPEVAVRDCLLAMEEECVSIPWQKGDFLLIDNMAVLHSRRPLIAPPRRILASFCK